MCNNDIKKILFSTDSIGKTAKDAAALTVNATKKNPTWYETMAIFDQKMCW